jgi:hypothetical protein
MALSTGRAPQREKRASGPSIVAGLRDGALTQLWPPGNSETQIVAETGSSA